jgi:hypothetical protein
MQLTQKSNLQLTAKSRNERPVGIGSRKRISPIVQIDKNGRREHVCPSRQVIRRGRLVEAKLVKELPLIPVLPLQHG